MTWQTNPQLELACEYVRNTNKNVFLTGKAGTGKTTFLHQIKEDGRKCLAIVAPTGVAAINAGGMTIHSLFQLPLGLHLPGVQRDGDGRQPHFKRAKIRLIRSLDLLVIDEISMVRADLLDSVDEVLRRLRHSELPFGGLQLLMIGDLHQLPPVVKPEDWEVLRRYYDTAYFFGSRALQRTDYISIELKQIFRQSDPEFIGLLNKVRDNRLDEESLRKLNSRYVANFRPPTNEAYITLTATNAVAADTNARNLQQLPTPQHAFQARIAGEFPPSSYPTEVTLEFKVGAQVMFIRNDSPGRRYFNGKIGQITWIGEEAIHVRCPDDPSDIEVTPVEWQNVKYELNEQTRRIAEKVLGTFTQYPLKLAWAITIHKSQGLTFERAIIDAQAAFACGQVYVALSRCKSFEGIVLRSRISGTSVKTDPVVNRFTAEAERNQPTGSQLEQARRQFQASLLHELFCFESLADRVNTLRAAYSQHSSLLPPQTLDRVQAIAGRARTDLFDVAQKFAPRLAEYLDQDVTPAANEPLQGRVRNASTYFVKKLTELIEEANQLPTVVDNQAVASALASQLRSLQLAAHVSRACFAACGNGFTTEAYSRAKVNAELDFEKSESDSSRTRLAMDGVQHPALYRQLFEWRERTAQRHGQPVADVVPDRSLRELVKFLPTDDAQLRLVRGIGKERRQRYGQEIVAVIQQYLANLGPSAEMLNRQRPRASQTRSLTLELLRAGKSVEEIAAARCLARGTIEGHLAHFIELGELDVYSVLDQETVEDILQLLTNRPDIALAEAKSHFGEKYSYGQLKLVLSHLADKAGAPLPER